MATRPPVPDHPGPVNPPLSIDHDHLGIKAGTSHRPYPFGGCEYTRAQP